MACCVASTEPAATPLPWNIGQQKRVQSDGDRRAAFSAQDSAREDAWLFGPRSGSRSAESVLGPSLYLVERGGGQVRAFRRPAQLGMFAAVGPKDELYFMKTADMLGPGEPTTIQVVHAELKEFMAGGPWSSLAGQATLPPPSRPRLLCRATSEDVRRKGPHPTTGGRS